MIKRSLYCKPRYVQMAALALTAVSWLTPITSRSQTKPLKPEPLQLQAKAAPQAKISAIPVRLEISLEPSRKEINAGEPLGIVGTLANISADSTVYVTQGSVSLMLPPELVALQTLWTTNAYFPSEGQRDGSHRFLPPDSVVLALRPGQRMTLGWSTSPYPPSVFARQDPDSFRTRPPSIPWRMAKTIWYFAFFTPDDYHLAVQAKYWTDSTRPRLAYSTVTGTVKVHVLAPQIVIVIGAAIGGLIAYVMAFLRKGAKLSWKDLGAGILAMLWSAVVAVLLSRTAEAQLPIRVTVADMWGGIAIGILAYYLGVKGLKNLTAP